MFDELEFENDEILDEFVESIEQLTINNYIRKIGKICHFDEIKEHCILIASGQYNDTKCKIYINTSCVSFVIRHDDNAYMLTPTDIAQLAEDNGLFCEVNDDNQ